MSPITSHVLDTGLGRPAGGVEVSLDLLSADGGPTLVGRGVTNADGRVTDLLAPDAAAAGVYRLSFETGNYFATSARETLYPKVEITFQVTDPGGHYHIPLLISPFGYTTYRGS